MTPAAPARWRGALGSAIGSRFGKLLSRFGGAAARPASSESLLDLAGALLSLRGRASGPALASAFFDLYEASDTNARYAFLAKLHANYPRDAGAIDRAIDRWLKHRDEEAAQALNDASESPCLRLINMLNLAPGGTRRLLAMRTDLLEAPGGNGGLKALDSEFEDAFTAWFNAGFLELRRLAWDTPAAVLEKIIRYEAVHSIAGWDDLRSRVEPADRRCYGFFHPQMPDEPLIFVEVALTEELPGDDRRDHFGRAQNGRSARGEPRDLLFDLELPGWPARHSLRQFPDQAGRRTAEQGAAAARNLRDAFAGARLRRLAQAGAG